MSRILGIDPGSRKTGFGIMDTASGKPVYVTSGCIRVTGAALADKLHVIFDNIRQIISEHQPDTLAIEQVFMHKNAASALKLGQARGAAIVTAAQAGLQVFEYTPTQIKSAIVGAGRASKDQINHMVQVLLSLPGSPQEDAADALAVALCHHHMQATLQRIPDARIARGGRIR